MKLRQVLLFALVASALLLQACTPDAAAAIQTGVAQTLQIADLQTRAAGNASPPTSTTGPVNPAAPTETPSATLSPTSSTPFVSVNQNTNCRTGPSSNYGFVVLINAGQQLEVLKVYNGANYVVVRNPAGSGDCWLWLEYATPANFASFDLPIATQPPTPTNTATPTPTYIWQGDWTTSVETGGVCTMTLTHTGNTISGTYTCPAGGGYSGSVSGTVSADLRTVNGTWTVGVSTGAFTWERKLVNVNQFVGNWDSTYFWCGARGGASQPDPCLGP